MPDANVDHAERLPLGEGLLELTAAVARGDEEAFARFYRGTFDLAFAGARRLTGGDESFCLDVVHDVMLRAIRALPPIDREAALRRWLRLTVRSCACDRLRSEARRRRRERRTAEGRPEAGADEGALTEAQRAFLRRELAALDEPAATLVSLRHRAGWSLERIGAALGLSGSAVDGRLRRAVLELRRRWKEASDDR